MQKLYIALRKLIDDYIGLRIFKTALSVFIAIYTSRILGHDSYFSGLAAVITTQNTIESSWEFGRNRIYATMTGLVVAFGFHYLGILGLYAIFVGIILVIKICLKFGWKKSISLACIVFIVVMMFNPQSSRYMSPYHYGLIRFVDTVVGVIISLLINKYIFPLEESKGEL